MAEETKWEGKATAKVNGVSADKVWPLIEDYCNIHKWIPNTDSARLSEGEPGKLGCVRYCTGPPIPGTETPTFTNEKLVAFDPEKMSLSYEVLENNVGFNKFVATITVVPEEEGCTIEWSFVSDPAPHWSVEKIMGYIGFSVQYMAQTIEQELKPKQQGDGGKKWAGKTSAKVAGASADSVWSLLSDFCTIYKWLPNLESTRLVEGESGKLGCVRHSDGPPLAGATAKSFTYEKLVAFDPAQRTLSYEVLENNIGFGFFMGTLKVLAGGEKECTIEWSFTADPMTSWTEEQIQEYVAYEVQTMATRMAEALQSK